MSFKAKNILKNLNNEIRYGTLNYYHVIFFVLIISICYMLVYRTAIYLGAFVDEIVALTSSYNFFTSLNFDASNLDPIFDGNYKPNLSTGPFSSFGSAFGWIISKNLIISRMANFIWINFFLLLCVLFVSKIFRLDKNIFFILSLIALLIQPWWFGSLYSLGETFSTICLFSGFILFSRKRALAVLIMSFAIWFGKDIHLLSFAGFYIYIFVKEKNIKNAIKDFIFFSIPLAVWLTLVYYKYDGTIIDWFIEYYNFVANNQSVNNRNRDNNFFDIVNNFRDSEISTWGIADFLRTLIMPVISYFIFFKKNILDDKDLRNIIDPIFISTIPIFAWFWILSPTKWIRYSQTFVLTLLLCFIFILSQKKEFKKKDLVLIFFCFGLFLSSNLLFVLYNLLIIVFLLINMSNYTTKMTHTILIIFLTLSLLNSYQEIQDKEIRSFELSKCVRDLNSRACFEEYMNG